MLGRKKREKRFRFPSTGAQAAKTGRKRATSRQSAGSMLKSRVSSKANVAHMSGPANPDVHRIALRKVMQACPSS